MDIALVALLFLVGAVLRIPGLNAGLWRDEIDTLIDYVLVPAQVIVSGYGSRNNHIFYSLLAHFSVGQFGVSAWSLRLPAMLFGSCTIPAAYYFGRQLASRNEALLATAFLTFSYHHVWFSQDGRGYSGLLLGCVLSSICFVRLLGPETSGRGTVLAYALIAAFTCWIHLIGSVIILAHGLTALGMAIVLPGRSQWNFHGRALAGVILAGLFTVMLYLPSLKSVLPEFLGAHAHEGKNVALAWGTLEWISSEFRVGIARAVPGGWPLAFLAVMALAFGIGSYLRQSFVAAALLILPVLIIPLMVMGTQSILFPRFLTGALVFLLLLSVRGGFVLCRTVMPRLSERKVMVAGLLVALCTAVMVPGAWRPKQDYLAAAAFLDAQRSPGDAVICSTGFSPEVESYVGLDCERSRDLNELLAVERAHTRTWFIYAFPIILEGRMPEIWSRVQHDYSLVKRIEGTVVGGDISIMRRSNRAPPFTAHDGSPPID